MNKKKGLNCPRCVLKIIMDNSLFVIVNIFICYASRILSGPKLFTWAYFTMGNVSK